ncbi:hypothetical protein [Streptomyces apricus]|uniref:Uncharacterized protein n=1 Tax=Streptomyces apricus TaxID=1828112 RepID=A0A5B0BHD4_9ACTN|nr:hypothetical protein [Streptomyces apricus]KAA0941147.1 hypothetical protein FGF04_06825 [Streptomyces apricus]
MTRGKGDTHLFHGGAASNTASWNARAGWLLKSHRLRHEEPNVRTGASFGSLFGADERDPWVVSASTVSRWENGTVPLPRKAVPRYEKVLGMAPHSLLAVIETVARYQGGHSADAFVNDISPRRQENGRNSRNLDVLLDKILDGERMSGDEWDALTAELTSSPVPIAPARIRRAVTERLLEETLVSSGLPWMRRFEALSRLLADPGWAQDAVAACADVGCQKNHVGLIEALCALDGSSHPDAARHVLRQLRAPTNADSFHGALLACVRKVQRRHFDRTQLAGILHVVADLLRDPSAELETLELAALLLPRLPASQRFAAALNRTAAGRTETRHIITHQLLTDPVTARISVARLLGRMALDADPPRVVAVLRDLLDDVLHHPVSDVRLYSAMLLRASPYRETSAAALAAELTVPATVRSERAVPVLHALRVVGTSSQRPAVARLTLADGLPSVVLRAAVHALGHIGGRSPEQYWRAVLRYHLDAWARRRTVHGESELKRLVYAFGMAGELELLVRLLREEAVKAPAQAMSMWWTSLPRHIRGGIAS